jgi:hypothetical protein
MNKFVSEIMSGSKERVNKDTEKRVRKIYVRT